MEEIRVQYTYDFINAKAEVESISGYAKLELFLHSLSEHSKYGVVRNLIYSIEK